MLYSIITTFPIPISDGLPYPVGRLKKYRMNSILLTGLLQRLLVALLATAVLWGVYFWAVAE